MSMPIGPQPKLPPELLYFPPVRPASEFARYMDLLLQDVALGCDIPAGRMRDVCMLCGCEIRVRVCAPEQDGSVSHGLCEPCVPLYQLQIDEFFRDQVDAGGCDEKPAPESSTSGPAEFCAARVSREIPARTGRATEEGPWET